MFARELLDAQPKTDSSAREGLVGSRDYLSSDSQRDRQVKRIKGSERMRRQAAHKLQSCDAMLILEWMNLKEPHSDFFLECGDHPPLHRSINFVVAAAPPH